MQHDEQLISADTVTPTTSQLTHTSNHILALQQSPTHLSTAAAENYIPKTPNLVDCVDLDLFATCPLGNTATAGPVDGVFVWHLIADGL
jgi:hypothetical protein